MRFTSQMHVPLTFPSRVNLERVILFTEKGKLNMRIPNNVMYVFSSGIYISFGTIAVIAVISALFGIAVALLLVVVVIRLLGL